MTKKALIAVLLVGVVGLAAACSPPPSPGGAPGPLTFPSYLYAPYPPSQPVGLWVSGEGKATFAPDVVMLSLGIEARESSVAQAQLQAREAMGRVVAALKAKGVAEKDIQTTHFSIQPIYEWQETKRQQVLVGYQVSNQVRAKVRPVERAGEVIDAVAEAGGDLTRINDIALSREDLGTFRTQAREQAIADALAKARHMAQNAGLKLGKVVYITESSAVPPPQSMLFALKEGMAAATPILPGELEVTVTVQVVYAIE